MMVNSMRLNNRGAVTLGVDLGGTKISAALVDAQGKVLASDYRLVDLSKDPEKVIAQILLSLKACEATAGRKPAALGLGVAGQIDRTRGTVLSSPNLPSWVEVPLKTILESQLKIPVSVDNDVRVITMGEWRHGAGRGEDDLVCLFLGTGVGGGAVSGGRLIEGATNTAAELGHLTVVAGGRKCRCPNEGCLEAYVGGWAIAERAQDAARANPQAALTLLKLAGGLENISAITVSEAYQKSDPLAQRLVKDSLKYLAAGAVSIVNAFNPGMIILGGSVIKGFPQWVPLLEQRVKDAALPTPARRVRVVLGGLGGQAGPVGAAAMARDLLK
jgi:glucokinase